MKDDDNQKHSDENQKHIPFLIGNRIYLRNLIYSDHCGPYSTWFNDKQICSGNSHHVFPYTLDQARTYISQSNNSYQKSLILAVINKQDHIHIGNVALDNIDYINRSAEFAIIIGNKKFWGLGYGLEAGELVLKHGFLSLNLNRISCGTLESNVAMIKLAESLNMKKEGRRKKAVFKNGDYMDIIEFGILVSEYISKDWVNKA